MLKHTCELRKFSQVDGVVAAGRADGGLQVCESLQRGQFEDAGRRAGEAGLALQAQGCEPSQVQDAANNVHAQPMIPAAPLPPHMQLLHASDNIHACTCTFEIEPACIRGIGFEAWEPVPDIDDPP